MEDSRRDQPFDILLVEDNPGDSHLFEQVFENKDLPGTIHVVRTGDEALDWLYRRNEYAEAPRPDLVLLDLNLPATSGHEVLRDVKSDDELKRLPVVVLTGSKSDEDLKRAYDAHANACLVKPVDPGEFEDIVECVATFWGSTVAYPRSATGDDW